MRKKGKFVKRIGITGGIGSGKTEACKILERLGEKVLYADLIAKDLTDTNENIQNEIKNIFGSEFFDKSGKLDRKKLAGLVFSDDEALAVLNSIVHPHVFSFIDDEVEKLSEKGGERIFIEAALIFESCMDDKLDFVINIDADINKRKQRVISRDGMTAEEFEKRAENQLSPEEKARLSGFTIKNNGSLEELERNLIFITGLINNLKIEKNDGID